MRSVRYLCLDCKAEQVAPPCRADGSRLVKICPKCSSEDIIEKHTCTSCWQGFAPDTDILARNNKSYRYEHGEWVEEGSQQGGLN